MMMAEREGFEPSVRHNRTHAFQACPFDRSGTSPVLSVHSSTKGSDFIDHQKLKQTSITQEINPFPISHGTLLDPCQPMAANSTEVYSDIAYFTYDF